MTQVKLYEKKISGGRRSLYLDFYPPIVHPQTNKPTRREHLRLYIYERPTADTEKNHNKETRMLGEAIRAQCQLDVQNGYYGFLTVRNNKKNLVIFFEDFAELKRATTSKSNYENYLSVVKYVRSFAGDTCTFGDVTENFCARFREFLLAHGRISNNTASSYFDKFKYIIREAYSQKMLRENPAQNIKSIKPQEIQREFLTLDELQRLAATPFPEYESLRRAGLLAALTGLRFVDIEKLTWAEIQTSAEYGDYIRFTQKKTKDTETLPISGEARLLLGEAGKAEMRVFPNLNYSQCVYLPIWTKRAGIERKITFHCFRHTHATIQLSLGTDIYTVSKLLGHRSVKTTQIYARIIDETKRQAVNRIKLKI